MLIPIIIAMEKQVMTTEKNFVLNDLLGFENLELSNKKILSDLENAKEYLLLETISKNHNKIGEVGVDSLLEVISKNHNKIGEVD